MGHAEVVQVTFDLRVIRLEEILEIFFDTHDPTIPFEVFYPAESYHDDYYRRNRDQPHCRLIISPKVSEFKDHFGEETKA